MERPGKNGQKDLLELKCVIHKVAGYKVNIQKPITFLYTSNEQVEFEIKSTTSFTASEKTKYLGITLTKYLQDV
jgi:hypothetical protein